MNSSISRAYPEFVHEKIQEGLPVNLIDVRSRKEFMQEHADGAKLIPLDQIDAEKLKTELSAEAGLSEPLYLICTAGIRAEQAAQKLHSQGLENLYVIEGGTNAWKATGLPMFSKAKRNWLPVLSPQSQAQLFMGFILMLLALKGLLIHSGFIIGVLFVGLALMIASLDQRFCVAKVFEGLPWNRA